eukprot:scaffold740_cov405-Prasinococcus_capsulatus_cf.AAC.8
MGWARLSNTPLESLQAAEKFAAEGRVAGKFAFNHLMDGRNSMGVFHLEGSVRLEAGVYAGYGEYLNGTAWLRAQHVVSSSNCVVAVVQKSDMAYPLCWFAGRWPFDLERDGVFVELETISGTKRTWTGWLRKSVLPAIFRAGERYDRYNAGDGCRAGPQMRESQASSHYAVPLSAPRQADASAIWSIRTLS